ncbi:MAG TPA: NUDIX hydrolase [Mycobacteriales bacterium]
MAGRTERDQMPPRSEHPRTADATVRREQTNNAQRNVAVVGLRNERGEVLMIETSRLPGSWQPVGGGVDPDDAGPEHAAVREAKEELDVDLALTDLEFVAKAPYDFGVGWVHFFEAVLPSSVPLKFNEREILQHRWVPLSEARELPSFPATKRFLEMLA